MKEKQHLAQLLMLEKEPAPLLQLPPSPPPPPVPPRPKQFEEKSMTSSVSLEEKEMSFTETFEDLENTTLKLKEMAEKKAAEQLKETAGVVRDVAQVLLKAVDSKAEVEEEEDMTEGYSEGAEDFSSSLSSSSSTVPQYLILKGKPDTPSVLFFRSPGLISHPLSGLMHHL